MFGTALAHAGLGVTMLGMVGTLAFGTENIGTMKPGDTLEIGRTFDPLRPCASGDRAELHRAARHLLLLGADGNPRSEIVSAKRFYQVRQMATTEAGIKTIGFSQLYVSLGDPTPDGGLVVHAWWKPLVTLIWLGGARHDAGGRRVADRPPSARRRAGARKAQGDGGDGRMKVPTPRSFRALVVLLTLLMAHPALAVLPDEVLSDPALEARARTLSAELRCMVCQNQSIDDSNADLARDLRLLVRERLTAGDSDAQVIDFVVSRYGEFVLLKPRLSPRNALLWGAPVILLLAGAAFAFTRARGRSRSVEAPLSQEEEAALSEILRKEGQ